ncbi:UDP-glucose--hexose-1-phosphate uridylyltransferase [Peribacillus butanolivorans]|uniref:UDP-glucose--hexose-1-phosphate uridylyltransferase n=1 Tax=Peribacillus butanolivorans TaxID=421767 RepID=UPI00207C7E1A|nr:UDP-glucose--hexose-1-phosphate uridylyltransferase [Peribacillus butanolivorans]MCO0599269.1 UDP-glucose--hexose-1-phosphate uridylyltransferase [Peribacillus butanolivorans]
MTIFESVTGFLQESILLGDVHEIDVIYKRNQLLDLLGLTEYTEPNQIKKKDRLHYLDEMIENAVKRALINDTLTEKEILESKIMDVITPAPSVINAKFNELFLDGPKKATAYFYQLSKKNDYIKTRAIQKNIVYGSETPFGELEVTINLSKPEKDPKEIADVKNSTAGSYPKCQLCMENEGYAGRLNHPARSNHRIIRFELAGEKWGFQYSPYAYYDEHAIFLSSVHKPMVINRDSFQRLLLITEKFPHYFVGSNADLPIVGGSILSHDHYQGGAHNFTMAKAESLYSFEMSNFPQVQASVVKWPMSVIRLRAKDAELLTDAATSILEKWRTYTDEAVKVIAKTSEWHNTITPIARRRGKDFEMDLVLRNNRTTEEYPDGIFHPHQDVQHIKKENIGLIEVMGLAVLPPRLKDELLEVEKYLLNASHDIKEIHRPWAEKIKMEQEITPENVTAVLKTEVANVFLRVLTDAGVFKMTDYGVNAFKRFTKLMEDGDKR